MSEKQERESVFSLAYLSSLHVQFSARLSTDTIIVTFSSVFYFLAVITRENYLVLFFSVFAASSSELLSHHGIYFYPLGFIAS